MEQIVSSEIVDSYFKKIKETLSVDVAIVGGGPSGSPMCRLLLLAVFSPKIFSRLSMRGQPILR